MKPSRIAHRLIKLVTVAEAYADELDVDEYYPAEFSKGEYLGRLRVQERYGQLAQSMIEELREALDKARWNPNFPDFSKQDRERRYLSVTKIFHRSEREILRGFVVPQCKVPILAVPEHVALYLITIDNSKDFLERENHNMGWHYHYLDRRRRRSNAILSWDTRWTKPKPETNLPKQPALFVEQHGEGKSQFKANYSRWGEKKRKSIYMACKPDLEKWSMSEFRCASNKSQLVHPPGRILTPHSSATTATAKKSTARVRRARSDSPNDR